MLVTMRITAWNAHPGSYADLEYDTENDSLVIIEESVKHIRKVLDCIYPYTTETK